VRPFSDAGYRRRRPASTQPTLDPAAARCPEARFPRPDTCDLRAHAPPAPTTCSLDSAHATGRIRRLAASVETAPWLVPEPARADHQRRLRASLEREAQGTGARARFSDRVRLLHDFLANQRQSKVTSKEVLRYLLAHGIEIDAKAVARLMAAKCEQGLLTRLARGQYRSSATTRCLRGWCASRPDRSR